MKCARNLSATAFPSVMSIWHISLLKNAFAPPVSVMAISCIGKFGMFIENALRTRQNVSDGAGDGRERSYLSVASDARRLVEKSKMKPCTSSSRNAFAP